MALERSGYPTFDIYTGALRIFWKEDAAGKKRRYMSCTASSTIKDDQGHEIVEAAIDKMARTAHESGMTIFLNHSYEVPEDVFGTVTAATSIARAAGMDLFKDLDFEVLVNESNPRASQTADAIEGGAKLGVSIGALVREYEPLNNKRGFSDGGRILDLDLKEASIVGLPANPRSWVHYATKAIRRYTRDQAREEDMDEPIVINNSVIVEETQADEDETLALLDQVVDPDISKVFTTEDIPSAPPQDPPAEVEPEVTEAEAETEPETPDASDGTADDSPDSVTASETPDALHILSTAIDNSAMGLAQEAVEIALRVSKQAILERDESIKQLTEDRDAALVALRTATAIIEKIATLPLGRKATFAAQVTDYRRNVQSVYSPEFMKFLQEPSNES